MDESKILGIVHLSPLDEDSLFIEHLQVYPKMIYLTNPVYKGIGTGILNCLKQMADKIVCFPALSKSVKDFYYKNNFIEYVAASNCFVWNKEK